MRGVKELGVALLAALAGCTTGALNNATMKTAGGPLIQAHRGSRGERWRRRRR